MWNVIWLYHNWILGVLAIGLWVGVIVWYMWPSVLEHWRSSVANWNKD